MAIVMLSQCSTDRWMSLTARVRVPNPVRSASLIMALRCSDPGRIPEILSYQAAKVGQYGQGSPPVTPSLRDLILLLFGPVLYKFFKNWL